MARAVSSVRELLNVSEYARRRGVSHAAVNKAIRSGRLRESARKNVGRGYLIDPALADREWAERTNPAQERAPESRAGGPSKGGVDVRPVQEGLFGADELERQDHSPAADDRPGYLKVQTMRVGYQAKIQKLDYLAKAAKLVSAEDVAERAFTMARRVRDRVRMVPERIAALVAAETNVEKVRTLILAEIDAALEDLARVEKFLETEADAEA